MISLFAAISILQAYEKLENTNTNPKISFFIKLIPIKFLITRHCTEKHSYWRMLTYQNLLLGKSDRFGRPQFLLHPTRCWH